MMKYDEAMTALLEVMRKDYAESTLRSPYNDKTPEEAYAETEEMFFVESGRSYDKIVKKSGNQRCCSGFVCRKDNPKKGFVTGDLLMSAGWNGPATNFARGNMLNGEFERVRWTGVL